MTKRQKQIKYLLDYRIDTLQHFIEEGGWPCKGMNFDMFGACPWLMRDAEGCLARNKKVKIDDDLLAAYWKFRFKESQDDYIKLANAVEQVAKLV